jgi:hypothetical protein
MYLPATELESLKIVGEISEGACTDQNFEFNITLFHGNDDPTTYTISMTSCSEGIEARKDALNSKVVAALGDDVTVSLIGNATLALSFDPNWDKVKIAVPANYSRNIFGLSNDTQKKLPFQFANGLTELEASLDISGSATVSTTILDSIEAGATLDSSVTGSLHFQSGTSGQLIPLDNWFSNLRSITNPTDPFHDPDFASATVSVDGSFNAEVELRTPFELDVPVSFEGFFAAPFELNLLDTSAIGTARPDVRFLLDMDAVSISRPDVKFDIDLPHIGDIGSLSFGDAVNLLKQALDFLVGDEDEGHSVESCSGGLLGKQVSISIRQQISFK